MGRQVVVISSYHPKMEVYNFEPHYSYTFFTHDGLGHVCTSGEVLVHILTKVLGRGDLM
jgi:hypothetical protein